MFDELVELIKKDKPLADFEKLLIKGKKKDIDNKDEKFQASLIHWAAIYNRPDILASLHKFILPKDRKRLFSARDSDGQTALHWCSQDDEGSTAAAEFFLKKYPELLTTQDNKGLTPLHLAASNNCFAMVDLICAFDEKQTQKDKTEKGAWLVYAKVDGKKAIDLSSDVEVRWRLRKSALRQEPLRKFVGVHLSTHRNYLADSVVESSPLTKSELYYRSEKHPVVKELKKDAEIYYTDQTLAKGDKAHVGSYGNALQLFGNQFTPNLKVKPKHHPSDAKLYNSILAYKNTQCEKVLAGFAQKRPNSLLKIGHWNDYPSVMVHIPDASVHKADASKKPSQAAFENWADFILSYYVGLLNYAAYQKNLPIEIERRGGFGFHMPTAAPTNASFRISMGIVPDDYVNLMIDVLVELDDLLTKLSKNELDLPKLPKGIFCDSDDFTSYFGEKFKTSDLNDLVELLWAQTEKGGQTTVQNVMRTTYSRDGISAVVFRHGHDHNKMDSAKAFNEALVWVSEKIYVSKAKKEPSLSFRTEDALSYPTKFRQAAYKCEDKAFWEIIKLIHKRVSSLADPMTTSCLESIQYAIDSKNLQYLYADLDFLNEAIFSYALESLPEDTDVFGDAYGSDSEEEASFKHAKKDGEVEDILLCAKKVVTHSGMRAIWAALIALQPQLNPIRVYLQNAYYETPLGIKLIADLQGIKNCTIVKKLSEANVVIYDLNACITNGSNHNVDLNSLQKAKRYMILDATSASTSKVNQYLSLLLDGRAQALLVVESGFKNQQLAGDKNAHGIVRIFSKNANVRDRLYEEVKKSEKPIVSAASHHFRHAMKFIGATPSNRAIFDASEAPTCRA